MGQAARHPGERRRLGHALLLALATLVLPAAARAIDLVGQTEARFTWSAASGPVAGYSVFVSRNGSPFSQAPEQVVTGPAATVTGAFGESVAIYVQAFDAGGQAGPPSPASEGVRFVAPAPANPPQIVLSHASLETTVAQGETALPLQLTVRNGGGGRLDYLTAYSQSWIALSTSQGSATTETDVITVQLDTAALPAGTHQGVITVVNVGHSQEQYVPVTVTVTAAAPPPPPPAAALSVSPGALSTSATQGSVPASAALSVRNAGGGTLAWVASSGASWLVVAPGSGSSTGETDAVTISFSTASLPPGTHTSQITLTGSNGALGSPTVVPVSVTIAPPPAVLSVSKTQLPASASLGGNASGQSFTIRNSGGGTLAWSVSESVSWLSISPQNGSSTGEADTVSLSFSTASLAAGTYTADVVVSATGVSPRTVRVDLEVTGTAGGSPPAPPPAVDPGLVVGAGPEGQGMFQLFAGTSPFASLGVRAASTAAQDVAAGDSRIVACELDGDAGTELVTGFGRGSTGRVRILDDAASGHAHEHWIDPGAVSGDAASNGETFPACGDFDGDGRDEIVVGLGRGGRGRVQIFDDAQAGFVPLAGTPKSQGVVEIPWPAYADGQGEVHPAAGDLDGDGRAELVLGLGTGGGGWLLLLDDAKSGFAPLRGTPAAGGWLQVPWSGYGKQEGASFPALGDLDGDGRAELVIGLGVQGAGWLFACNDAEAGYAPLAVPEGGSAGWLRDPGYAGEGDGTVHPALGDLDGDGRAEIVLAGAGTNALHVLDDAVAEFAPPAGGSQGRIALALTGTSNGRTPWPGVRRVAPRSGAASIGLSSAAIVARARAGGDDPVRPLAVRNLGGGRLEWSASSDRGWIALDTTRGSALSAAQAIGVRLDVRGLAPGLHRGTISVSASGAPTKQVPVTLRVSAPTGEILVGLPGEGGRLVAHAPAAPFQGLQQFASSAAGGEEAEPAACDTDGDGVAEYALGLGAAAKGRVEVRDDRAHGFALLATLQVAAPATHTGRTRVACGDVDGDGRDELAVGLGTGGGGLVQLFDDAGTGFAPLAGTPLSSGRIQVPWPRYVAENGETRPALGDVDGDGRAELLVGFGQGGAGWVVVFEDATEGFAAYTATPTRDGWLRAGWPGYDAANGETFPAAGDLDGDGRDEVVVGFGPGGAGWVRRFDDGATGLRDLPGASWLQLPYAGYLERNGTSRPAIGNLDRDEAAELVIGVGQGGEGWALVLDDLASADTVEGRWLQAEAVGDGSVLPALPR